MQCPHCGEYEGKVIKSTLVIRHNFRMRVRICTNCGAKIPTVEKIDLIRYRKMNPRKPSQLIDQVFKP